MPRYVAFLRAVSPMNAKMPELKRCLEAAGFTDVKTLLSSGNVVFTSPSKSPAALEQKIEAAFQQHLGRTFLTLVRSSDALQKMLASNPYAAFQLPAEAKRVVSFLRTPRNPAPQLPVERNGARILVAAGREVFSAYVPSPRGPAFMVLIEKTFGKEITTRTWDTVTKCAKA